MTNDELLIMLELVISNISGSGNTTVLNDVSPDSLKFVLTKTINVLKGGE